VLERLIARLIAALGQRGDAVEVQSFDARVYSALGITARSRYYPQLLPWVMPTVQIPLAGTSAVEGTFNDAITDALEAFLGVSNEAALLGNFSMVQLKNPLASGRVVYVDAVIVTCSSGPAYTAIHRSDADLAGDDGAWLNKHLGQAAGVAHLRSGTAAALAGTELVRFSNGLASGSSYRFAFNPPMKLDQGVGILGVAAVQNAIVAAAFEGREVQV